MYAPDVDVEGPQIDPEDVSRFRNENPEVIAANEAAARVAPTRP